MTRHVTGDWADPHDDVIEDEFVLHSGLLSWEPVLAELEQNAQAHETTRKRRILSMQFTIRARDRAEDVTAFARFIGARRWSMGHLPEPPSGG